MRHFIISRLNLGLTILALALTGCAPNALAISPEQSAIRALLLGRETGGPVVDRNSIQVRQATRFESTVFVLISFEETEGDQHGKCQSLFEMVQLGMGVWRPDSSSGGCMITVGGNEPPPPPAVEVSGGHGTTAGPSNPGFISICGMVNWPDIVKVRVNWNDGQQQVVDVINSSYLAVRSGDHAFKSVEGLNSAGEMIYSNDPQSASGKDLQ